MAQKEFVEEWVYSPTDHTLTNFDAKGHTYEIDLDLIKAWKDVVSWIGHVFQKAWASNEVIRGLLDAFDHFYEMDGAEHRAFKADYGNKWLYFPKPEVVEPKPASGKLVAVSYEELTKIVEARDVGWERDSYIRCVRAGLTK